MSMTISQSNIKSITSQSNIKSNTYQSNIKFITSCSFCNSKNGHSKEGCKSYSQICKIIECQDKECSRIHSAPNYYYSKEIIQNTKYTNGEPRTTCPSCNSSELKDNKYINHYPGCKAFLMLCAFHGQKNMTCRDDNCPYCHHVDEQRSKEEYDAFKNANTINKHISKPLVSKPLVSKPLVSKQDVSKPLVSKPLVSKQDVSKPHVSKQDVNTRLANKIAAVIKEELAELTKQKTELENKSTSKLFANKMINDGEQKAKAILESAKIETDKLLADVNIKIAQIKNDAEKQANAFIHTAKQQSANYLQAKNNENQKQLIEINAAISLITVKLSDLNKPEVKPVEAKADAVEVKVDAVEVKVKADAVEVKADAVKADAVKADAVKADAVKADAVKADAVKADAVKADAVKADAAKVDAVKADAVKADAAKVDAVKADAVKADAVEVKADAVKAKASWAELSEDDDDHTTKTVEVKTDVTVNKQATDVKPVEKKLTLTYAKANKFPTFVPAPKKKIPIYTTSNENNSYIEIGSEDDQDQHEEEFLREYHYDGSN
jgi:hypothetical protein